MGDGADRETVESDDLIARLLTYHVRSGTASCFVSPSATMQPIVECRLTARETAQIVLCTERLRGTERFSRLFLDGQRWSIPRRGRAEQFSQTRVVCRWLGERRGESGEGFVVERKVTPIDQNRLGLPPRRFYHKLGATLSRCGSGPID
jgi:hypothetical protein